MVSAYELKWSGGPVAYDSVVHHCVRIYVPGRLFELGRSLGAGGLSWSAGGRDGVVRDRAHGAPHERALKWPSVPGGRQVDPLTPSPFLRGQPATIGIPHPSVITRPTAAVTTRRNPHR